MSAAAAAGALAAATQLLPSVQVPPHGSKPAPTGRQVTGYRLTEHVKRYYLTALV
jgi:hypothetical protein